MPCVSNVSFFLIGIFLNVKLWTFALNLPLSTKILSDAVRGGYDLISVTHRRPLTPQLETNDPSSAMMAWIPWNLNFSTALSFHIPEIMLVIPRNSSEFISTLKIIGTRLNENKFFWKTWSPSFFIYWPVVDVNPSKHGYNPETELLESLRKINVKFRMDCDIYIFLSSNNEFKTRELKVYEIYTLGQKLKLQQIILQGDKYFIFSNYLRKAVRRQNFHRALIRPVAFNDTNYQPQMKINMRADGTVELITGLSISIFSAMEYALNFSYRVVLGDGWIEQDENGTWSGMATQLMSSEADISINLSTLLAYRLVEFDFLHSIYRSNIQAFFRQPKARTIRDILINPLNFSLRFCIMAMWTLSVCSIGCIYYIGRRYACVERRDKELFNDSLIWIVATFCQKGWYTCPTTASMKVVFLTATVFGLVIFISFSAALVPVLSFEFFPIKTVTELGKSHLRILEDIWLPSSETKVEEIESYRSNYKKPKKVEQFIEIDNAIPQLLKGDAAFVTFSDGFLSAFHRHHADLEYCSMFYQISFLETPPVSGYTVKKGSQYKEIFNHKLLMIREKGILNRNLKVYRLFTQSNCKRKGELGGEGGSTFNALGILDVGTAYFILGGGVLFSLLNVTIEYLIRKVYIKCFNG